MRQYVNASSYNAEILGEYSHKLDQPIEDQGHMVVSKGKLTGKFEEGNTLLTEERLVTIIKEGKQTAEIRVVVSNDEHYV